MKKKKITIGAITLIIAGLLIASSANAVIEETKEEKRTINWNRMEVSAPEKRISELGSAQKLPSLNQCCTEPLFIGDHPGIANGGSTLVIGFENPDEQSIWFTFSPDTGGSWHEDAYGWDLGYVTYPSVTYSSGNRFYATVVPDWYTNDEVTLVDFVDATDPTSWVAGTWDWEDYNIMGFEGTSIASGPTEDDWRWGFITLSGYNGYDGGDAENCPFTMYATGEQTGTISWLITGDTGEALDNCVNPANDLDPIRNKNYGVWERYDETEDVYNIEFRRDKFNYNPEGSSFDTAGELTTPEDNHYPDVCAYDNQVIIVSQTDSSGNNDIICYYSSNGLSNFGTSYVASSVDDESYPRIVAIDDTEAICTFVKNGDLYFSMTNDGGQTWDTPMKVNDEEVNVNAEYHAVEICGLGTTFADDQGTVHYKSVGTTPIITMGSITGGMGVTAVIKNVGTADAIDVPYSITATGGILGKINKEDSGTISITADGETTIALPMIIGLGEVIITVTVGEISEIVIGTQLLIYTKL